MKLKIGLILFLGLGLAACSDDGIDPPPVDVDAAPPDDPCLIEGPLGTIAPDGTIGGLSRGANAAQPYHVEGKGRYEPAIVGGTPPDWFMIQMWDQTATFPTALQTGTFDLAGDDLQFQNCGLCVMLVGNHTGEASEERTNTFMATGGSVTVSSVAPNFSVSIENVNFRHVQFDNSEPPISSPHPSGCTASVSSLSFNVDLMHINTLTDDQLKALEDEGGLAATRIRARREKLGQ